MPFFQNLPSWLGEAMAAILTGTAVYFYRSWREASEARRVHRAGIVSALDCLRGLLLTTRTLFEIQQQKMDELTALLRKNHPQECECAEGYEETFVRCFDVMDESEKNLHGVIRAYTEHSLRPINGAISDWLRDDLWFKTGAVTFPGSTDLAEKLRSLEIHILLWRAKFEYWIPGMPQHAVVYMADEKKHGLGFPSGTDAGVAQGVKELRRLWFS